MTIGINLSSFFMFDDCLKLNSNGNYYKRMQGPVAEPNESKHRKDVVTTGGGPQA